MPPKTKKVSNYTEDQLREMSREDIIDGMTDREVAFCEYYINDYNAKMAAIKAGYKVGTLGNIYKIVRSKQCVINYIAWLKLRLYDKACVSALDIFNGYVKMAFYDVTDYIDLDENGSLKMKDFKKIDGQIIQEIRQSPKGGLVIKFPDRLKAFEKLENYMDNNPYDWKRRMEEKKLEIMSEKLTIEKSKAGMLDEIEDDGFLEALEKAALKLEKSETLSDYIEKDNDDQEEKLIVKDDEEW